MAGGFRQAAAGPQPDDWACPECGFSNFSFRTTCKQCRAVAPGAEGAVSGRARAGAPPTPFVEGAIQPLRSRRNFRTHGRPRACLHTVAWLCQRLPTGCHC